MAQLTILFGKDEPPEKGICFWTGGAGAGCRKDFQTM